MLYITRSAGLVLLSICAILCLSAGSGHPYEAYNVEVVGPKHIAKGEKRPREAWVDGLTFRPCGKPVNELTPVERYILRGLRPSDGNPPWQPEAWSTKLTMFAFAYASKHQALPDTLTEDALHEVGFNGTNFARNAAWFRNPITNEYPALTNPDFTPGGVYLRLLTPEEVRFQAQWDHTLAGLVTSKKMQTSEPGEIADAVLVEPVIYYRFYGESGVLDEGITFLFFPADPSK